MDDKDIAKDILIAMINKDALPKKELSQTEISVEVVCKTYKKILKTVRDS